MLHRRDGFGLLAEEFRTPQNLPQCQVNRLLLIECYQIFFSDKLEVSDSSRSKWLCSSLIDIDSSFSSGYQAWDDGEIRKDEKGYQLAELIENGKGLGQLGLKL